jgi:hypothetical protein
MSRLKFLTIPTVPGVEAFECLRYADPGSAVQGHRSDDENLRKFHRRCFRVRPLAALNPRFIRNASATSRRSRAASPR